MATEKSLPRGFTYLTDKLVINKYFILDIFVKNRGCFNKLVEFPPIAFTKNFKRGSNILGDKVYEFNDKKGRSLILTPDSLVHTFSHYNSDTYKGNARYAWISPTFRYRHAPTRHFYQIGYSSINYNKIDEIDELILCLKSIKSLINNFCNEKVTLKIVYPNLIKSVINNLISDKIKANEIFSFIQRNGVEDFYKITDNYILKETLEFFFTVQSRQKLNDDVSGLIEVTYLKKFLDKISLDTDFIIELDLAKIYSSEILSGVGTVIEVDNKKFGDGGIYSEYGTRHSSNIKSVVSVCTGINPLSRKISANIVITEETIG